MARKHFEIKCRPRNGFSSLQFLFFCSCLHLSLTVWQSCYSVLSVCQGLSSLLFVIARLGKQVIILRNERSPTGSSAWMISVIS